MAVPLAQRVTPVTLFGFPVPVTRRVMEVMLMVELLGLVRTNCWTGTLEVPESWLELPGGLGPWVAETVTAVGVEEGVKLGVAVNTKVFVGVAVAVGVAVLVGVKDAVAVAELVGVLVAVKVAVLVAVLVGV